MLNTKFTISKLHWPYVREILEAYNVECYFNIKEADEIVVELHGNVSHSLAKMLLGKTG